MFCRKCGAQLDSDAQFCASCGASALESVCAELENESSPPIRLAAPNENTSPVLQAIKTLASSKKMLVASAASIMAFIFAIVAAAICRTPWESLIDNSNWDPPNAQDIINATIRTSTFLNLIPLLLVCVGLCLFCMSARGSNSSPSKLSLSVTKLALVVKMVYTAAIPIASSLIMIYCVRYNSAFLPLSKTQQQSGIFTVGIMGFVIGLILALPFIYYLLLWKTVHAIQATITTEFPSSKLSSFSIVMNYVVAVYGVFFSLFSAIASENIIPIIGAICTAVALFIVSKCLSGYKKGLLKSI